MGGPSAHVNSWMCAALNLLHFRATFFLARGHQKPMKYDTLAEKRKNAVRIIHTLLPKFASGMTK